MVYTSPKFEPEKVASSQNKYTLAKFVAMQKKNNFFEHAYYLDVNMSVAMHCIATDILTSV